MTDNDPSGNDGWTMPGEKVPPLPPPLSAAAPQAAGYAPPPAPGYAPPPSPGYAQPKQPGPRPVGGSPQPTLTYRSWQPGIVALRPLPFGDFITVPFKAMRFNRAVIIGGPLLLFTVSALLTGLALWIAFNDSKLNIFSNYDSFQGVSATTIIGGVVAMLSWVVSDVLATSIIYPAVARAMLGERISLSAALKAIVPRIGHLLLFAVIVYIPILIVGGGAFALMVAASAGNDNTFGVAFLGGLAIIFLVMIPLAIAVTVYSAAARGIIILERANAFRAVRRAFTLVPGRFWWSVLIVLVVGLIVYVVQQVFTFVIQFVAFVPALLIPDSDVGLGIGVFVGFLFYVVAYCVTQYSFLGSTNALIYLDMRMRKEGLAFDLAKAAEARHAAAQGYMA